MVPSCAGSVAYMTVDGQVLAPFFQLKPYPSLKVTKVDNLFTLSPTVEHALGKAS